MRLSIVEKSTLLDFIESPTRKTSVRRIYRIEVG
jgi:hypothetical protein